ncbi:hypothetical protein BCR35DRAFT_354438 [Leucosporidium creatinivorum]|uniref:Uncharacterized protein n=1 Tax=Leucosporidium creatinivorum TaxID=106004 RepID=A0A1Y2EMA0_9BASI|nr:hypothetical protein BCR35DRAFT_354438 [Leucosporidium creatinivorum]
MSYRMSSQAGSIRGISLLTLLLSFFLLSLSCSSPSWTLFLSTTSPTLLHLSRTSPPLLNTLALNSLDGSAIAALSLFILATVWECLPTGTAPPLKAFLPCYLLLLRPLLDVIHLARSVQYNLFLALVLLFTLLLIQAAIRVTAKTLRLVYRVTKGTLRLGTAVSSAVGKALRNK